MSRADDVNALIMSLIADGLWKPENAMTDIVRRLRATTLDKDNFPRMDCEKWLPVGLAREAADEIERLRALLQELIDIEGPQPGTNEWANKVRRALEPKP